MSLHNYTKISLHFVAVFPVEFHQYKTMINEAEAAPEVCLSRLTKGTTGKDGVRFVCVWTIRTTGVINIIIISMSSESVKLYKFNGTRRLLSS